MNRSELAALISSTMPPPHSSTTVRASHPSPNSQLHLPVRNSPRQHSQIPSRRRGHTRYTQSEADASSSQGPDLRTPRANQGPIPRPLHARSYSHFPQVKSPQIVTPGSLHGHNSRKSMAAEIEEPDFVKEEREAWNRNSPKLESDLGSRSQSSSYDRATKYQKPGSTLAASNATPVPMLDPRPEVVLQPPRQSNEVPPQPRKQSKKILPLREFGPAPQETQERPKTSRGPSSYSQEDASMRSEDSADTVTKQATRRSKFLEGSLNERSAAVASSWCDHESVSEGDSDMMPRASRETRERASLESSDSKPLPITPATVKKKKKKKLFNLKSSVKSSEYSTAQHAMPKKKGLRKSLSTWNFHNLGDKIKILGGSNNDLSPKATKPEKDKYTFSELPARDGLEDRKRKTEEAYVQELGLKKQKSNNGIANFSQPSQPSVAMKPTSLKRRTPSASSRTPSSSYHNRVSSSTTNSSFASDHSSSDLDNSKRPSRRELEKENQHLRKMLRHSSSMQLDAHRSSFHLPLDQDFDGDNIPRLSQENFAQGHKMRLSPGKKMGRRGEDVPPMPKLSREVFGSLENGWNARVSTDGKGILPRPVSMILEEEESKDETVDNANGAHCQMSPVREQWEWPEDVF